MDKKFEKLRFDKTENKELILSALSDVYDYIIKKKLILVGGMSLDLAFRLRGTALYSDDVLPDYDFLSWDHYNDAIELGVQLQKKFANTTVDAIVAKHITTMRVRVDGVVVADISYCPKIIFDRLPTIKYKTMTIIHPYYTLMDQLDAFSNPYKGAPMETVAQRWSKDLKRMEMILKLYPIEEVKKENVTKNITKKGGKESTTKKIKVEPINKYLIGWNALVELKLVKSTTEPKIYVCDKLPVGIKKMYNKTMSIPKYGHDENKSQYYDCSGIALVVNDDKRTAALQTIGWFFASDWVFNNNSQSLLGLEVVINALLKHPIKASPVLTFPHIDETNELQIKLLLSPSENGDNAIKPQNINFTKYTGTKPTWDYATSLYFQIDGKEVARKDKKTA